MRTHIKKQLLALVACAIALCCLSVGFASEAEEDAIIPENLSESDIIGEWQLSSIIVEGSRINPAMIGIDMRYEFREDHTAQGTYAGTLGDSGQAQETWALDAEQALICVSDKPFMKVRCEDGTLFLLMDEEVSTEDTGVLVFTRAENP